MTRKEQIEKASEPKDYRPWDHLFNSRCGVNAHMKSFSEGAEWADANPISNLVAIEIAVERNDARAKLDEASGLSASLQERLDIAVQALERIVVFSVRKDGITSWIGAGAIDVAKSALLELGISERSPSE